MGEFYMGENVGEYLSVSLDFQYHTSSMVGNKVEDNRIKFAIFSYSLQINVFDCFTKIR